MRTVNLAFEEYGCSTNQPLIILHGFFASSRNWRKIATKLANTYHLYIVDLRNHGLSPHNPKMDYPAMSADLAAFMQQHKLQTANIMGHSMGGKVAMWFALNFPEKLKNLIVVDISPVSYQHDFNTIIQALKNLPLKYISNRKQADDFLSLSIPKLSYRQFLLQNLQFINGQFYWRIDLQIFYETADKIVAFPATELIPPYTAKVLFIMGEHSDYLDKATISTIFPSAEITILKDTNHWLHVEKPAEFCAQVDNFLQKND